VAYDKAVAALRDEGLVVEEALGLELMPIRLAAFVQSGTRAWRAA
jgi:hypothetical protein